MTKGYLGTKTTRGIVLGILKAYNAPGDQSAKEIEALAPLLQSDLRPEIRAAAGTFSRYWMGQKQRDPQKNRRVLFYRLKHMDSALEELERLTRPNSQATERLS